MEEQKTQEQTGLLGNSTGKPDRNLLEHEMLWQVDNNSRLA